MFGSIKTGRELEQKIDGQWEYRKNKGFEDVNIAIQKGLKMGHGKTEREIECVAMYLETVLKKVKVPSNMFNQENYTISERKLECSKTISIFKYLKDNYNDKLPLSLHLINNTLAELESNNGIGVTPQTYNCIIRVLLLYVPEEIKNYPIKI